MSKLQLQQGLRKILYPFGNVKKSQ